MNTWKGTETEKQYEYKCVSVNEHSNDETIEQKINEVASQGYRVVNFINVNEQILFTLERVSTT
ncbi:MAG: DUF4177 domain-containing protein [Gemmatimonadetes bacterium]|nr:DUF4177 domain-containing protein [Gemmatimonadota bacterium]MYK52951.1 DUF4177 domain-containing protein [Gemmatimonadota bacterium]